MNEPQNPADLNIAVEAHARKLYFHLMIAPSTRINSNDMLDRFLLFFPK